MEKLLQEMYKYEQKMKEYLPIEKQILKLRNSGIDNQKIEELLGKDSYILNYVPATLYHGSSENLDKISSKESTQKGHHVYATDNPVHALFFAIFRNSSEIRGRIKEYLDETGNYKIKYVIDERIEGMIEKIITDRFITIHVCDGKDFVKPNGNLYINREWISKDGMDIIPIDKITVNVKDFFTYLQDKGLVTYYKYNKNKDWQTVIDMLSQNYPFGLGTEQGKNITNFDLIYDDYIATNFPEQFAFSKKFRDFVKEELIGSYENDKLVNEKLKYIKKVAYSFLNRSIDELGNTIYTANFEKINDFMNTDKKVIGEETNINNKIT